MAIVALQAIQKSYLLKENLVLLTRLGFCEIIKLLTISPNLAKPNLNDKLDHTMLTL